MLISLPAQRKLAAATALAVAIAWGAAPAHATPFTITTPSTVAQILGSGETGTIAAGGSLTVSDAKVAVTITGNNATLSNQGTLFQTGTDSRAIRDDAAVSGLTINNGSATNSQATIRTADGDVIQMNKAKSSVVLNNWGTMESLNAAAGGAQAVDFSSSTGSNVVNNMAGGKLLAKEADAVRPGTNGVVNNDGTIRSTTGTGSSSDGIDGQENSGIRIVNGATGLVDGGRHGITAGQVSGKAFTLDVSNAAGGVIQGSNGSGLNIDGFDGKQLVTVRNAGTIVGNGVTGDGDGVDVDGLVDIVNTGIIRSTNAVSAPADGLAYSEGISAGGGRIVNAGTIEGLVAAGNGNAVGRGITLAGNDLTGGVREALYGNATIVNQAGGIIRGQSDSAIAVTAETGKAGFTVTIDNNAGARIIGGGTNAAIRGNGDNTTIVNAGLIDGGAGGKAIQLGSGMNALFINGGSARVIGDIDGGSGGKNTMTVAAGAGNTFAYNGKIANFAGVDVKSGTFALEGDAGIDSGTALVLSGGTLKVGGLFDGEQTFASLVLAGDSAIDFGATVLTFASLGSIADGAHLALNNITSASGTALRFLGDISSNAGFLALMSATGLDAAHYRFDGRYTNVIVDAAAVPEPASIALFAGGLGLMGALVRRRRV